VIRWLGTTNFELAYRDQVILLDAFYNRGPRARPIGVSTADIRKATVLLIGHAHSDHIADAATIAKQTGAVVVTAPTGVPVLEATGLDRVGIRVVSGLDNESLQFPGFTVTPVLAQHSQLNRQALGKFAEAMAFVDGGPSPEDSAAEAAIEARGSNDPAVRTEGTIAYLIAFDSGLTLLWLDSAGPITEAERALMARVGRTDIAIIAYQGQYLSKNQVSVTLPLIQLFRPALFIPSHHDALPGYFLDLGVEPLFEALRDQLPATKSIAPLYRTPICVPASPRPL